MTISQISDYVKKHEALLFGTLALALVLYLGDKYINYRAKSADESAAKSQQILQIQIQANEKLQDALAAMQLQNSEIMAQAKAQNDILESDIARLQSELSKQQAVVHTEPLPELALQWQQLIGINGVTNTQAGLVVTEPAARETVSQLVEIPSLKKTVEDQQGELDNSAKVIDSQSKTLDASNKLIDGLKVQITDSDTACKKDIAAVKASEVKSKRKWFVIGYGLGLATRGAIKLLTGI